VDPTEKPPQSILVKLFSKYYAPILMHEWVRPSVIVVFLGWLCASIAMAPKIDVGLEQDISMPGMKQNQCSTLPSPCIDDSYVLTYFDFMKLYLSVGPNFYITMNTTNLQFDYSDELLQNRIAGSYGTDPDSLQSQVCTYVILGACE